MPRTTRSGKTAKTPSPDLLGSVGRATGSAAAAGQAYDEVAPTVIPVDQLIIKYPQREGEGDKRYFKRIDKIQFLLALQDARKGKEVGYNFKLETNFGKGNYKVCNKRRTAVNCDKMPLRPLQGDAGILSRGSDVLSEDQRKLLSPSALKKLDEETNNVTTLMVGLDNPNGDGNNGPWFHPRGTLKAIAAKAFDEKRKEIDGNTNKPFGDRAFGEIFQFQAEMKNFKPGMLKFYGVVGTFSTLRPKRLQNAQHTNFKMQSEMEAKISFMKNYFSSQVNAYETTQKKTFSEKTLDAMEKYHDRSNGYSLVRVIGEAMQAIPMNANGEYKTNGDKNLKENFKTTKYRIANKFEKGSKTAMKNAVAMAVLNFDNKKKYR
jgi:hypothetical protein